MFDFVRRIWADVKRGENLDLYVTVVIAIAIAILNILGLASQEMTPSITLAILALLTVAMLGNRYRLDTILSSSRTSNQSILQDDFTEAEQQQIIDRITSSNDLLIIGTDLEGTLQRHYSLLERRLKGKKRLRIILVDPRGQACNMLSKRRYRPITGEQYRAKVHASLEALHQLKERTNGQLQLRVLDFPIARGGIFADINTRDGILFTWNHTFKTSREGQPKLVLQVQDGYWYSFFREEAESTWAAAQEWKFNSTDH